MEEKKYEAIVEAILFTMGESVELELYSLIMPPSKFFRRGALLYGMEKK